MRTIQDIIKKCYATPLGEQATVLYSTSDNRVFIRSLEAIQHIEGKLDPDTKPLADKTILEWYDAEESEMIVDANGYALAFGVD